jgi:hypothetical protein
MEANKHEKKKRLETRGMVDGWYTPKKRELVRMIDIETDAARDALFCERRGALVHEHVAGSAQLEVDAEVVAAHNLKPHFESVAHLDLLEYALGGARGDLQMRMRLKIGRC